MYMRYNYINRGFNYDSDSVEKLLPAEDTDDSEQGFGQFEEPKRNGKSRRYLRRARNILICALAFWGLFNIITQIIQKHFNTVHHEPEHSHHQHPEPQDSKTESISHEPRRSCACGSSTAEAIEIGCVYDSLSPAWVQPYCQDAELTAEFETLGDGPNGTWIYYADRNHTQELSMPEVMALADDPAARFHVSWEWHVVHCYMYWIKQFRAQTTGIIVEARFDNEGHIRHCAEVFQNRVYGTSSGVVLNADLDDS
ncbi:hypothetical protein LHYA1_G008070 [Lachnellula hyalina]|uniref:Uncharacterized protein n=1 Tax=Lachnellula hyalina TaxID=1316788 RepID=A0A8H8QVZ8_9HELO|nr:uncharacterized protein LHYA1_G008070 [Lachnellula hyalina]TVY23783.1 hypothetical protein LHYA1_G008070 [Lachnellula hyalina]